MRHVCSSLLAVYGCSILLRSLAHTFPCSTEWEGHQGYIAVVKLVLITIHTWPLRIYWRTLNLDTVLHPLPQHLCCLHTISVYDKIHSWLGWFTQPYKRNMGVTLYDVGWMNDGSNHTYMTVLTPEKKPSQCCWKATPPGSSKKLWSECNKKPENKDPVFSMGVRISPPQVCTATALSGKITMLDILCKLPNLLLSHFPHNHKAYYLPKAITVMRLDRIPWTMKQKLYNKKQS